MRIVRWFITHGILAACLWAGFVHGVDGARNVALVMVWLAFALSLLFTISRKELAADVAKKPRQMSLPRWFDASVDVAIAAFLVWHGYVGAGVCYLLHIALLGVFIDEVKKQRAALADRP